MKSRMYSLSLSRTLVVRYDGSALATNEARILVTGIDLEDCVPFVTLAPLVVGVVGMTDE